MPTLKAPVLNPCSVSEALAAALWAMVLLNKILSLECRLLRVLFLELVV